MCGIAGTINDTRDAVINGMLDRIRHRGPDGSGACRRGASLLGSVRLSIIDLPGGAMPMDDRTGRFTLVYNGEIYGFRSTRDHFAKRGYQFRTQADTEVIFPLYENYGLDLFRPLNGMFAFALYDAHYDSLLIARDHYGIKPLVYTVVNRRLYFASEVKSFYAVPEWRARADMDAWHTFLNIRFPPAPLTLFDGVRKIPPGCYLLVRARGGDGPPIPARHVPQGEIDLGPYRGAIYRYYQPPAEQAVASPDDAVDRVRTTLAHAASDQMVADVPLGVYLSGGIDSSTVAGFAAEFGKRRISTFCLGFNEPADENADAAATAAAIGADHTDERLSGSPLDTFRDAVYFMEEPKVNCLQNFVLARAARARHKVVLSGLGGDEIFGGYDIYEIGAWLDYLKVPPVGPLLPGLGMALGSLLPALPGLRWDLARRGAETLRSLGDALDVYLLLRNGWDHDATIRRRIYARDLLDNQAAPVRTHFERGFPYGPSLARSFMEFEFGNKMVDDFLANEDRMSMAHGLEARVPLLDRRIVDLIRPLPVAWKVRPLQRKILLRRAVRGRLPAHVLRKRKHGFTFDPVAQAGKDLRVWAERILTPQRVAESGIFRYDYIRTILDQQPHPALRWHYFLLWKIVGYHVWEDIFIRNGGRP